MKSQMIFINSFMCSENMQSKSSLSLHKVQADWSVRYQNCAGDGFQLPHCGVWFDFKVLDELWGEEGKQKYVTEVTLLSELPQEATTSWPMRAKHTEQLCLHDSLVTHLCASFTVLDIGLREEKVFVQLFIHLFNIPVN